MSIQILHTLRHFYFISNHVGATNNFSQYAFINFTAIDILSHHPDAVDKTLNDVRPTQLGQIPAHPLERMRDLFFLNTAEHFTLVLSPETNEHLLLAAATPYLTSVASGKHFADVFESSHSVFLAVLSAPQCTELAAAHLPFYVDTLFRLFPTHISSRQFRLAFKTLLQITSPPSALSASHSFLAPTLLELLRYRALSPAQSEGEALDSALHIKEEDAEGSTQSHSENRLHARSSAEQTSEHATLTLALIDCLPALAADLLTQWLPLVAELIEPDGQSARLANGAERIACVERFWEMLSSGEMDFERSAICAGWWSTGGGREIVLGDQGTNAREEYMMSGALSSPRESKL